MTPLKTTAAALAGLAVLALIAVQFVPWANAHFETQGFSGFGFTFPGSEADLTAHTWNLETSAGGQSDTTSWFDGDMDDADGVGMIRAAIPILLVGAVVTLAGALVGFARAGALGPVLTLVAGIVLAVGTTLFVVGTHQFYDDADFTWSASFYLAIVACVLALTGGVLGLASNNTSTTNTAF